jgi:hypothetical protein
MAKKHMRKCSASLSKKEMQKKPMVRFHHTPVRIATIKNTNSDTCWQRCKEKGVLIHCWWEGKLPLWKNHMEAFQKTKNRAVILPSNTTPNYIAEGMKVSL